MAFNLLIPVFYQDHEVQAYVPEPLKDEVNKISKLLAYFYQQITAQNEAQETLIIDWERLLEEASASLPNHLKDSLHNSVNLFLQRCCDGFSVIDNGVVVDYTDKNLKIYTSDNDFMNRLKGTILFTLALSRYLVGKEARAILQPLFTSSTISELKMSSKKSCREQQVEDQREDQVTQEKSKVKKVKVVVK